MKSETKTMASYLSSKDSQLGIVNVEGKEIKFISDQQSSADYVIIYHLIKAFTLVNSLLQIVTTV